MPAYVPDESPEWKEWRDTPTSEDNGSDSKDGRYHRALNTHADYRWPLPYESYERYIARQLKIAGEIGTDVGSPFESNRQNEYVAWRFHEPYLRPVDDN